MSKQDFHRLVGTDRETEFTGNALVLIKRYFHPGSVQFQGLRRTDRDAGGTMDTSILVPLHILSKRLNLHPDLSKIIDPGIQCRFCDFRSSCPFSTAPERKEEKDDEIALGTEAQKVG